MKVTKSVRALAAAATLATLVSLTACEMFAAKEDDNDTSTATVVLSQSSAISIEATNLGDAVGDLTTHNPDGVFASTVPYLPVLKTELYSGTTPFVTFTFNKAVTSVFGSTYASGLPDTASDTYFYTVNPAGTVTGSILLAELPIVSGNTVRFNLPAITTHTGGSVEDDGDTLAVGNKYIVDFFVKTTDRDMGRVTIGFMPKDAPAPIGAFGDANVRLYANTAEGQAQYSLHLIDSERVFFLNRGTDATHVDEATDDETVQVGSVVQTAFDTWESRYDNGPSVGGTNSEIYESLDALALNGRVSNNVELYWDAVENATEYAIYTTDEEGNATAWDYIESVSAVADQAYMTRNFDLSLYPITGYRAVRIVPMNNVQIGTEGEIQLVDTVRPVTSQLDNANAANSFQGAAAFTNHIHGNAESEGEIVDTGTKALGVIVQPDTNFEDYVISNVSGSLSVTTSATNGTVYALSVADVLASDYVLADTDRLFQLGTNAVGVLDSGNNLSVLVHLRCYLSPAGTITYTDANTPITGNISVTFTDLSGNAMISRTSGSVSKNSGVVVFVEQ